METIKVGDEVKVIAEGLEITGHTGVVVRIDPPHHPFPYEVDIGHRDGDWPFERYELEKVEK